MSIKANYLVENGFVLHVGVQLLFEIAQYGQCFLFVFVFVFFFLVHS